LRLDDRSQSGSSEGASASVEIHTTDFVRVPNDAIILTPSAGELRIDLKGNLAAMLSAATNAKRSPETGDLSLQVQSWLRGLAAAVIWQVGRPPRERRS
jgi:hypothetical protein